MQINSGTYGDLLISKFPSQKISDKKKNKSWHEDNVKAALQIAATQEQNSIGTRFRDTLRLSKYEMYINRELARGETDPRDMSRLFNPTGNPAMEDMYKEVHNYPIEHEYFNLLIGENSDRKPNYKLMIMNPEMNEKKQAKKIDDIYASLNFLARSFIVSPNDSNSALFGFNSCSRLRDICLRFPIFSFNTVVGKM